MTREEAKVKNFDILHFVADNAGLSTFEAIEKAYNMGVSEQEAVLDKIRAEIERQDFSNHDGSNHWYMTPPEVVNIVVGIIDEYKAESEK